MSWQKAVSRSLKRGVSLGAIVLASLLLAAPLRGEQIPVIQRQGALHGFLLLLDEQGKQIAVGEQINVAKGNVIYSRLIFKFTDGSLDDESAVYNQGTAFQLVSDHHIQKGPSFPKPSDITIDVPSKQVTWIDYSEKSAQQKREKMDLPSDLANGLIAIAAENFPQGHSDLKVSYLAVTSKPRLIQVQFTPDGNEGVRIGSSSRQADRFNLHFDLKGLAAVIAPVIGKQPPDSKIWVSGGEAPIFLRMSGPLYEEGPAWTMVLTAPSWSKNQQ